MFWSGETLTERLPELSEDFRLDAVDCNSWTLTLGDRIYKTPTAAEAKSGTHTIQTLRNGESFQIPPGQFAFLETHERVKVPNGAMAFISIKATIKLRGLINVSGFHVDPGYEGNLIFTVFNAGPNPIHLHQGQKCFLIWFASLDNEESRHVKTSPSNRQIDGNMVSGIAGRMQSFDEFSSRLADVERTIHTHTKIGGGIVALVIALVAGLVVMFSQLMVERLTKEPNLSVPASASSTAGPAQSHPDKAQSAPATAPKK